MGCGASVEPKVIDISVAQSKPTKLLAEPSRKRPEIVTGTVLDSGLGASLASGVFVQSPHSKQLAVLAFNGTLLTVTDLSSALSELMERHASPKPATAKPCLRRTSTTLTKSDVLGIATRRSCSAERIEALTTLDVQQPINCCNVTAVAFSLSSLGCETSVDDIMMETDVEPASIVSDGLTLAQTYQLATTYIARKGHPIFLRCYHFDAEVASLPSFWGELSANVSDAKTVFVLNFNTGIAHGTLKGGGHFAVAAATINETQEILVSDVHPLKYGRYWTTSAEQMFQAMVDKDSTSQRAPSSPCHQ